MPRILATVPGKLYILTIKNKRNMRIVQTFWSGAANPLSKTYGWPHAEYNLMSWALSCCYLRRYYDNVVLYTDQRGYEILIERLHLPYTEVHVVYDDNLCLPIHWAYAKISTYYKQKEPFIHIDGDVYISQPFSSDILRMPLVAQNKEICTKYYKDMMSRISASTGIHLPDYLQKKIEANKISSYNMGIFGGYNLEFIHKYCDKVFDFFELNNLNNPLCEGGKVNCNIFFEQIMFAMTAEKEHEQVSCILDKPINDNGYTGKIFCDIENIADNPFLHIIGGHKKNMHVCQMLRNATIRQDIKIYKEILSLFPCKNVRFEKKEERDHGNICLLVEQFIAKYEDIFNRKREEWKDISDTVISEWMSQGVAGLYLLNSRNSRANHVLSIHPYCFIYEMATEWPKEALDIIKNRLGKDKYFYLKGVLFSPCLEGKGVKEIPLSGHAYQIMSAVKLREIKYEDMLKECLSCFGQNNGNALLDAEQYIINEITGLIRNGILFYKES